MTIKVNGLIETQEKLDQVAEDSHGKPMIEAMRDVTLLVTRSGRENAPVDRGQLRASIIPEVKSMGIVVHGIVGSNRIYAAPQELGTRPFWAPLQPLIEWVTRKRIATGAAVYAVAKGVQRKIARSGIKAKRYLTRAVIENESDIYRKLDDAVYEMVEKR